MSLARFYLFMWAACLPMQVSAIEHDDIPSLEMLEFLAEWSVEDQAWLDQETEIKVERDDSKVEVEDE